MSESKKEIILPANIVEECCLGKEISEGEYKGWYIYGDTDSGRFDAEKGAMTEFEITLTSPDEEEYIAIDGYYTACTGAVFHRPVKFTLVEETPIPTIDQLVGEFTTENSNDSLENFVDWLKDKNPGSTLII